MNKKTKKCKKGNKLNGDKLNGGKALTSGGFGCLFKPALRCKNTLNYDKQSKKLVTKLMTTKHARDEFKQISLFKSILDHIPNYQMRLPIRSILCTISRQFIF